MENKQLEEATRDTFIARHQLFFILSVVILDTITLKLLLLLTFLFFSQHQLNAIKHTSLIFTSYYRRRHRWLGRSFTRSIHDHWHWIRKCLCVCVRLYECVQLCAQGIYHTAKNNYLKPNCLHQTAEPPDHSSQSSLVPKLIFTHFVYKIPIWWNNLFIVLIVIFCILICLNASSLCCHFNQNIIK